MKRRQVRTPEAVDANIGSPPRVQHASLLSLRRPQTVLWRSVLAAGGTVRIGALQFRMALSDQEARDILAATPHAWVLRLADDLWSQEVLPGSEHWEEDQE